MKLRHYYNRLIVHFKLEAVADVILFVFFTISIHIVWKIWSNFFHYAPVQEQMHALLKYMTVLVYDQSFWISKYVLQLDVTSIKNEIIYANGNYIYVTQGCSGVKQIMQFVLLMLLFRGSWKRKLWFIPMGIIVMHITNLVRVVGLGLLMHWGSNYNIWLFSHDYLFRPFFYVVLFFMWIWWVEIISPISSDYWQKVKIKRTSK